MGIGLDLAAADLERQGITGEALKERLREMTTASTQDTGGVFSRALGDWHQDVERALAELLRASPAQVTGAMAPAYAEARNLAVKVMLAKPQMNVAVEKAPDPTTNRLCDASSRLGSHLRSRYSCWLAVGVKLNNLVVYYDKQAVPEPKIPGEWEGFIVEPFPTPPIRAC
jgi:hypothetical protein